MSFTGSLSFFSSFFSGRSEIRRSRSKEFYLFAHGVKTFFIFFLVATTFVLSLTHHMAHEINNAGVIGRGIRLLGGILSVGRGVGGKRIMIFRHGELGFEGSSRTGCHVAMWVPPIDCRAKSVTTATKCEGAQSRGRSCAGYPFGESAKIRLIPRAEQLAPFIYGYEDEVGGKRETG